MPDAGLEFDARVRLGGFLLEAKLDVGAGETLALVGPSGAGKSTCLALMAGLLRPEKGRISCGDAVWCDVAAGVEVAPERRRVGLVLQDYALFPHLTAAENVRYGPLARGRGLPGAREAARLWLERFGLGDLGSRLPGELSGGQRQRVALARALASDPQVLLLDEPFGALDVTTRGAIRSELRAFLASCGLPTVLVTHDAVDALAFGDRILVLENGLVSQVGPRDALLHEPRTPFVADLAGLNLYRGQIAEGTGLKEGRVGEVLFHVLADDRAGAAFLSFAPSEVALSAERSPGSPQNAFRGRVVEVIPLPDRLRIVLDVGLVLVAEITREAARGLGVKAGQTLWAAVKATTIRVYG